MQPSWRGSRLTKPGTSEALCLRLPCAHSVRLVAGRSCPVGDMVISEGTASLK